MNAKIRSLAVLAAAFFGFFSVSAAHAAPSWEQVEKVVAQQLNSVADYQPGDLISRGLVDPLFDRFQGLGWAVKDRLEIVGLVPSNNDIMVRQFRSGAGKDFMRQINQDPLGYDRVDQLDHVVLGPETVDALIATRDGYKKILNLGTSTAKQNQSWLIAPSLRGTNFNASTGRIYTAEQLLARLKKSYEAAMAGK
ncbi:MAG TPA: hypothetical protein VMJ32_02450 [Pirellulales bacterium]|nr:hypothetical protein [Pirellulales bacterium]